MCRWCCCPLGCPYFIWRIETRFRTSDQQQLSIDHNIEVECVRHVSSPSRMCAAQAQSFEGHAQLKMIFQSSSFALSALYSLTLYMYIYYIYVSCLDNSMYKYRPEDVQIKRLCLPNGGWGIWGEDGLRAINLRCCRFRSGVLIMHEW